MSAAALAPEATELRTQRSASDNIAHLERKCKSTDSATDSLQIPVSLSGSVRNSRGRPPTGNEIRGARARASRFAMRPDPELVRIVRGALVVIACACGQQCATGAVSARRQPFQCSACRAVAVQSQSAARVSAIPTS